MSAACSTVFQSFCSVKNETKSHDFFFFFLFFLPVSIFQYGHIPPKVMKKLYTGKLCGLTGIRHLVSADRAVVWKYGGQTHGMCVQGSPFFTTLEGRRMGVGRLYTCIEVKRKDAEGGGGGESGGGVGGIGEIVEFTHSGSNLRRSEFTYMYIIGGVVFTHGEWGYVHIGSVGVYTSGVRVFTYIYIERERDRERECGMGTHRCSRQYLIN